VLVAGMVRVVRRMRWREFIVGSGSGGRLSVLESWFWRGWKAFVSFSSGAWREQEFNRSN
jgi:hypothetical protein